MGQFIEIVDGGEVYLPAKEMEFFIPLDQQGVRDYQQWAQENYVKGSEIKEGAWHPVIVRECKRINGDEMTPLKIGDRVQFTKEARIILEMGDDKGASGVIVAFIITQTGNGSWTKEARFKRDADIFKSHIQLPDHYLERYTEEVENNA